MRAAIFAFLVGIGVSACAPVPKTVDEQKTVAQSRAERIAQLEAAVAQDRDKYRTRPYRTFVGGHAREYRFARYVEAWRKQVERIGELNYPKAAKEQKIYGNMVVTVAIHSDGSVESAHIDRSSGVELLDAAALEIVRLAAPFEPFPDEIKRDTNILHITRTWTFTNESRLKAAVSDQ